MRRLGTTLLMLAIMTQAHAQKAEPVTEIRLERAPCYGPCPIDEVVLRSDGTASYVGKRFVPRVGQYEGRLDRAEYDRLAKLLESRGFFELNDRYSKPITDHVTIITTATRGGKPKRVENYADAGPEALRAIEKEIIRVMEAIEWRR